MVDYRSVAVEPVPDFTASQELHNWATLAAGLALLLVVAQAVRLARSRRTPIPFLFLLGGALTYGYEPIVDVLGKCYLPEEHQWTVFTILDRSMPLYGLFVYTAFFGGFAMMAWSHLTDGRPITGLWQKYAAAIIVNTFLFETPAVPIFDVYTYYGDQPYDFWGFPLWWPFVNTAGPIAAGALVYVLSTKLKIDGARLAGLSVILIPMTDGAANAAAGYPTWMALNSDVPVWVTWGAGTVTILLGCLIVHGVIQALLRIEAATSGPGTGSPRTDPPEFRAERPGVGLLEPKT